MGYKERGRSGCRLYRTDALNTLMSPYENDFELSCEEGQCIVLEWQSQLSEGITLVNTIEQSNAMPSKTHRSARNQAWGFFLLPCKHRIRRQIRDFPVQVMVFPSRVKKSEHPPKVVMDGEGIHPARLCENCEKDRP